MVDRLSLRIAVGGLLSIGASAAAAADWRMAGTTHNSVAFVDLASVRTSGPGRAFTAMRISGQPAKDGWKSVVQNLAVNCSTGIFTDAGSSIEQADGSRKTYPGFGASQQAMSRGVFRDMFEIVCAQRDAPAVSDPKAWTRDHFKVGS